MRKGFAAVMYEIDSLPEVVYDEKSPTWSGDHAEYNWIFLRAQENWANDLLQARGYLFLNEILLLLGLPVSPIGQIVGWTYNVGQVEISRVDFGCWDHKDQEGPIRLCFNVEGPILHHLPSAD